MSTVSSRHRRYRAADPARRAIGWGVVAAVHALLGWALVSGTARKTLEHLSKPMQAAVIQEVTIPPPPPRVVESPKRAEPPKANRARPVAPKVVAPKPAEPPPALVPPPQAPPPSPAAVAVPSVQAPVASTGSGPPGPPAPAAPSAGPGRSAMGVACPTQVKPEMPRKAVQQGIEGVVKAQALIRNGVVQEVTILSGPRVYHNAVRDAMMQYKCISGPGDVLATQEFVFKLE